MRPLRAGLISLGCAKNLVDAELMLGALLQDGIEITNDPARADALIVNTCAFIDAAQEESVDAILQSAQVRQARRPGPALIVAGCLPQRFPQELPKLFPEVDAFMGVDQVARVPEIVRQAIARRAEQAPAPQPGTHRPKRKAAPQAATRPPRPQPRHAAAQPGPPAARSINRFAPTPNALASQPSPIPPPPAAALLNVHARPTYLPDYAAPRFRLTPRHYAYVKIAEGCNHPCSFCTIPRIRGAHRSRPPADILAEARALLADGVKELNLISQDSTWYGRDLWPKAAPPGARPAPSAAGAAALPVAAPSLSTLLRELNALPGDFWIRVLYTHPAHWSDELIATLAACPKVVRYVDVPFQHIHDNLLERMRRETSRAHLEDLLQRIRAGVPGVTVRTTFIVGFPGETEACFQSLLAFVRAARFERLGVFAYSPEQGTRASRMAGQVPDAVKRRRRAQLLAAQREVARQVAAAAVGRTLRVLVEGRASPADLRAARPVSWEEGWRRAGRGAPSPLALPEGWLARSEADAPEVDGRVFVRGRLPVGRFAHVRVIGHTDYDLIAEPLA